MKKFKFEITWQSRCRGRISPIIEANNEEEAREILEDTIDIDFNKSLRSDADWDVDSVEIVK